MLMISILDVDKKYQHSHAHALLRECLKKKGVSYTDDTPVIKGRLGKPALAEHPDIRYNLSHANGIAACFISDLECGVDCENVRDFRPNVMKRAFSEKERLLVESATEELRPLMFFRLWTLKEAYVKALGEGIVYPLEKAEFILSDNGILSSPEGCRIRQYVLKGGKFVVSVCELLKT